MHATRAHLLLPILLLLASPVVAQHTGTVRGVIVDRDTQGPLAGANVVVIEQRLGGIAGEDGRFVVTDVPVGVHRVQVSMIGYGTLMRTDVVVRSNRATAVEIELARRALDVEATVVVADYFAEVEDAPVSATNFQFEEIRRSPGSAGDISRLLQAMPSVNMNTDQRNDLIVRGGSPTENLILVDNIEIPNINHFPTQGASGGPIGLLNTDLIEDVDFYAGGFSAAYGDRLSSVMVVDMRDGNRSEVDGEANLGMAGAGLIVEGPLGGGRGAWILSGRRSYLDLIVGAIGTGAVPKYSDLQGKLTWDVDDHHRLSLLAIGGFDLIEFEPEDADEEDNFTDVETNQYVFGGNWRWLWSAAGFANTSIALTTADFAIDVLDGGQNRTRLFRNRSDEREVTLRSRFHYRVRSGTQLSWGLTARRIFSDFDIFLAADTNRVGQPTPELRVSESVTTAKIGAHLEWQQQLVPSLTATAGVRLDYFGDNEEYDLGPRLSLAWQVDPLTSVSAAWGIYYQNLPPSLLVQDPVNRDLENPRADHYVLGLRRRLTEATLFTLEGYYKDYSELPFDPDDPTVSSLDAYAGFGSPLPGALVGGGEAESWGAEAMLQKKLAQSLYGTLSYAYSRSRYTDLTGVERNRDYDNRHLFSLIVGYCPSDAWEYSLRWRYAGGRPYTPFDETLSTQLGTGVIDRQRVNDERLPAYHRLDLRFDHRAHYERFNLVSFFTLLNAYNRANLFTYYWDKSDQRVGRIDQWTFLPVGGFELEF